MDPSNLVAYARLDFQTFVEVIAFNALHEETPFAPTIVLDLMADRLGRCGPKSGGRLIINVPPRHLKSTCVSVAWPLFVCAHHPGCRVVVVAGNQRLSADLTEQRERILRSPRWRLVFPELGFKTGANGVRFNNGSGIVPAIVSQTQIGRGADLVIIDDPISPSHAEDDAKRTEINAWYRAEIAPRLNSRSAAIVVVMQRLHREDLSGFLRRGEEPWEHLCIPSISPRALSWRLHDGRDLVLSPYDPVSPDRQGVKDLRAILLRVGGRNFKAQYLQQPTEAPEERVVYCDTLVADDWTPDGPIVRGGFTRDRLVDSILSETFGRKGKASQEGKRTLTLDEWEVLAMKQQRGLLLDCGQEDRAAPQALIDERIEQLKRRRAEKLKPPSDD